MLFNVKKNWGEASCVLWGWVAFTVNSANSGEKSTVIHCCQIYLSDIWRKPHFHYCNCCNLFLNMASVKLLSSMATFHGLIVEDESNSCTCNLFIHQTFLHLINGWFAGKYNMELRKKSRLSWTSWTGWQGGLAQIQRQYKPSGPKPEVFMRVFIIQVGTYNAITHVYSRTLVAC